MPDYDLLIAGSGPVGTAAALAVRDCGLTVGLVGIPRVEGAIVGSIPVASGDPRPIALSHGSRLILERLGVWGELPSPTPIERIHVSQRGGFGRAMLDAGEARLPALGYVTDYSRLAAALAGTVERAGGCRLLRGTVAAVSASPVEVVVRVDADSGTSEVSARLLAVADGGGLALGRVRMRDYGQSVVTSRVACEIPHRNVAYERFTPAGPLALLPMGERLALVWTTSPERALHLCEGPEPEFLRQLQDAFGRRLGAFSNAGARSIFPLTLKVTDRIAEQRVALLGNAAQTLHPVAGQGLNLGLRDAWEFAATLRGRAREEIGAARHLEAYRARRRLDRGGGIGFTDALVRVFSNDVAALRLARGVGLAALGAVPPARDFLVRRMTFGTRG
jgi:2-octaprenyl-6-methoxyphenol hydroxylase